MQPSHSPQEKKKKNHVEMFPILYAWLPAYALTQ